MTVPSLHSVDYSLVLQSVAVSSSASAAAGSTDTKPKIDQEGLQSLFKKVINDLFTGLKTGVGTGIVNKKSEDKRVRMAVNVLSTQVPIWLKGSLETIKSYVTPEIATFEQHMELYIYNAAVELVNQLDFEYVEDEYAEIFKSDEEFSKYMDLIVKDLYPLQIQKSSEKDDWKKV